jgi:hypothetical protein
VQNGTADDPSQLQSLFACRKPKRREKRVKQRWRKRSLLYNLSTFVTVVLTTNATTTSNVFFFFASTLKNEEKTRHHMNTDLFSCFFLSRSCLWLHHFFSSWQTNARKRRWWYKTITKFEIWFVTKVGGKIEKLVW